MLKFRKHYIYKCIHIKKKHLNGKSCLNFSDHGSLEVAVSIGDYLMYLFGYPAQRNPIFNHGRHKGGQLPNPGIS